MSIAMATYNGERFLDQQLQSFLSQTHQPDELVICDDNSTDATLRILTAFAERAPFPVVVHANGTRLGYRRNFLQAGRRCSGDVIFFSDQDDVWAPTKVEAVLPRFQDPEILVAYHNARVFFEEQADEDFLLYDPDEQQTYVQTFCPDPFHFSLGFTQAYRKRLHEFDDLWPDSIDPFAPDQPLAHDQWFIFVARLVGRVAFIADALADHRQHGRNTYGVRPQNRTTAEARARVVVDQGRVRACRACAGIARALSARVPSAQNDAEAAAVRYVALADYLERREHAFSRRARASRLIELFSNVRRGAYHGRAKWRLPKRWLASDLWWALRGNSPEGRPVARNTTS